MLLLRNAAPVGHEIRKFTCILSVWFVQHRDSSEYKFGKFVHKIRHVIYRRIIVTGHWQGQMSLKVAWAVDLFVV